MKPVELREVSKSFGTVQAVRSASLVAPGGALTAVVGPSGCGKTTMLRLVAGFEAPDAGHVLIDGEPVAGDGAWVPPERRRVSMLFQQLALFPHLDVAHNVGYGLRRLPRRDLRQRVEELLELVGLRGFGARRPHELSGGQAQRVALARALAPRPAAVLLDEPFSSLDVAMRGEIRAEVHRILRAEGVTTLLVTHDQAEALALGDRVAVMLDGVVAQVGTPEEVYRHPASAAVAAFLGEANLLQGQVEAGSMDTEVGALRVDAPDGPAVVMVRPEDVAVESVPAGPGRVVQVEYYGHDQLVTVVLASNHRVRARLSPPGRLAVGDPVSVSARPSDTVVFSSEGPPPADQPAGGLSPSAAGSGSWPPPPG